MAYTTIKKSTDYFNTKLYTGNGSAGNAITGVGFQPDWTWIKNRDAAYWHQTFDAVRGASAGALYTNQTAAQDYMGGNGLASFNSDGFTVNSNDGCNGNGQDLVAWNWKAGDSNTSVSASGSGNNAINACTYRANTTAGFSICKWTGNGSAGATVGHGLGSAPKVVITKRYDGGTNNWVVGHGAIGFTKVIYLNTTAGSASDSGSWNNTAPSSTVFTVGSNNESNGNGYEFISYCFAEKTGYSKFGSYQGNNNSNGSFCYLGFKASFIMVKSSSAGGRCPALIFT